MKTKTDHAAVAVCLGGFGMALCAIGVILLATDASPVVAAIALATGLVLSLAMGVALGLAVRRSRT
ncbi:hypothetical protein [Microbacterium stercoris]|uniref:Uncharacterized protein n=1 Tax=Microbacterium stercoris TaxID=2820289 RepID=A0A939QJ57_9MICO|nr:hypothetical protein [Microbacterium stercoris]MBO3663639.1 hypothetical protein [Microbacterium stercoris]